MLRIKTLSQRIFDLKLPFKIHPAAQRVRVIISKEDHRIRLKRVRPLTCQDFRGLVTDSRCLGWRLLFNCPDLEADSFKIPLAASLEACSSTREGVHFCPVPQDVNKGRIVTDPSQSCVQQNGADVSTNSIWISADVDIKHEMDHPKINDGFVLNFFL